MSQSSVPSLPTMLLIFSSSFFFTDTATTEIYTLSLHDALPIFDIWQYIELETIPVVPLYFAAERPIVERDGLLIMVDDERLDRKSTRLNSSHPSISYAVFCLKKKKKKPKKKFTIET